MPFHDFLVMLQRAISLALTMIENYLPYNKNEEDILTELRLSLDDIFTDIQRHI